MPKPRKKKQVYHQGIRKDIDDTYEFRSGWEANIARLLNHLSLRWRYEYKRFAMKDGKTYLPDFRILTEDNPWKCRWLEVKGLWHKGDKARIISFMNQYPDETLKIIAGKEYRELQKQYKKQIPNWE